jgi:hypothetical protein
MLMGKLRLGSCHVDSGLLAHGIVYTSQFSMEL